MAHSLRIPRVPVIATALALAACHPTVAPASKPAVALAPIAATPSDKNFMSAVADVEAELAIKASPLALFNGEPVQGGVMFKTKKGLDHVARLRDRLAARGAFIFIVDSGFDSEPDVLGLVPATDKFDVINLVGTDGNSAHSHDEVVAWLKDLDRRNPWLLIGASYDFVDGFFVDPVSDPHALATDVLSFCPDFFYQGIGLDPETKGRAPLDVTEEYFKTERRFHFWWD